MKRYGLIGFPLTHTFSKAYFCEKFNSKGIDATYDSFPLSNLDQFPQLLVEKGPFDGLNVTIPYKEKIIEYLDELDKTAADVGAVNLVKFIGYGASRRVKGYNTDVYGFSESLFYYGLSGIKRALVLGTGGASKAVIYCLGVAGASVTKVSRKPESGDLTYNELSEVKIDEFDLIVNTTPLGMYPSLDTAPDIPYERLNSATTLYDIVYNPQETRFLRRGREMGCNTINGLKMLHLQAEKGWEIWQSSDPK